MQGPFCRQRIYCLVFFTIMLGQSFVHAAPQVVPKGFGAQENSPSSPLSQNQFEKQFAQAVRAYKATLREQWPNAEVSSASRAVFYSQDLSQKRVIDFGANNIEITLPTVRKKNKSLDYDAMKIQLEETLRGLMSMSLAQAIAQDPINQRLRSMTGESLTSELGALGRDLILIELFKEERPSIRAVHIMAARLLKKAYIRYPAVASLKLSLAFNDRTTYIIPLPEKRVLRKAKRYKPFIKEYAKQFKLPASLIFAITHTESHFNPMARSQIPAFGLMQIVPHTAGQDAASLLFKRKKLLSPSYLYNPKRNVEVGSAYVHLLYYRYLKNIKDKKSRMYCVIAAYNAGSTAVVKALTGRNTLAKAIPLVNKMTPKEVLNKLLRRLPSLETREYLNKVLTLQKTYAQL